MTLYLILGALTGLLFGSFLNVCIARIPAGESIVTPGSHCPTCKHPIRWYDNLPVLSWLLLRGRCRDCKTRIPWRYPAVELAYALWIVPLFIQLVTLGNSKVSRLSGPRTDEYIGVAALAILGFLLIGLIVMDWRTHRLPDPFTLTGIATGLFLVCCQAVFLEPGRDQVILNTKKQLRLASPGSFAAHGNVFLTGPENLIFGRVLAVLGAALILLVVRWGYQATRKREGLGLGDVKLLAMIAAFLGFWPAVLTLFLGTLLATAYGICLLARGRAGSQTRLPFGSFLGTAGLVAGLFGEPLIAWYSNLFR